MNDPEIISLNDEQLKTNLMNLCKILKLSEPKQLFSGKIKISQEDIVKYDLKQIKETGKKYELYECLDEFYFIIIHFSKFNVQHFIACSWFNHLFKPFVKDADRPKVYIIYNMILRNSQYSSIPRGLLDVPYRLVGIQDLHPLIGSPEGLNSFVINYKLLKKTETNEKSFNGKEFPVIRESDPAIKLVNAMPGDLIRAKLIMSDKGNVYTYYKTRKVQKFKSSPGFFDKSGLDNIN